MCVCQSVVYIFPDREYRGSCSELEVECRGLPKVFVKLPEIGMYLCLCLWPCLYACS